MPEIYTTVANKNISDALLLLGLQSISQAVNIYVWRVQQGWQAQISPNSVAIATKAMGLGLSR